MESRVRRSALQHTTYWMDMLGHICIHASYVVINRALLGAHRYRDIIISISNALNSQSCFVVLSLAKPYACSRREAHRSYCMLPLTALYSRFSASVHAATEGYVHLGVCGGGGGKQARGTENHSRGGRCTAARLQPAAPPPGRLCAFELAHGLVEPNLLRACSVFH